MATLYRLQDASRESNWVELPHKLTKARRAHAAFTVYDTIVECPINPLP